MGARKGEEREEGREEGREEREKEGEKGVTSDCLTVSGLRLSNPRRAQRGARWTWVNAW